MIKIDVIPVQPREGILAAGGVAQQLKVLAIKPDYLRCIPGTNSSKLPSDFAPCRHLGICRPTQEISQTNCNLQLKIRLKGIEARRDGTCLQSLQR